MAIKVSNLIGMHLEVQQKMILLFNGFAILQKDSLHKVMKLPSLVQETNQKETSLRNKFQNGLVMVIREFFLDLMMILHLMMYSNQNLQTSSLTWVVRLTLSSMTGRKLLTCGEIKVSL